MKIQIIHRACGGTEFLPQPSRLHLGAQNAEGVDRLQFQLPESWADCAIALYLRRSDGTQLAPVPLDGDACVTVDRRLTGCTGGQWMLAAVSGSGYTAYTRPGRYDTYATLPTDGGSEDLPPTLYEQFVARVLESASTAARRPRAPRPAPNAALPVPHRHRLLPGRPAPAAPRRPGVHPGPRLLPPAPKSWPRQTVRY